MILDFIELDTRHAFSLISNTRAAFSFSSGFLITNVGRNITSVIIYFPSTLSSLPMAVLLSEMNSSNGKKCCHQAAIDSSGK